MCNKYVHTIRLVLNQASVSTRAHRLLISKLKTPVYTLLITHYNLTNAKHLVVS